MFFHKERDKIVMTTVLETQQDGALNLFFRAVDSAEGVAEGRRRRLAESLESLPIEICMALAKDLHTWLNEQHRDTCAFMMEDVAVLVFPAADNLELNCEGSLHMVLLSQTSGVDRWSSIGKWQNCML